MVNSVGEFKLICIPEDTLFYNLQKKKKNQAYTTDESFGNIKLFKTTEKV